MHNADEAATLVGKVQRHSCVCLFLKAPNPSPIRINSIAIYTSLDQQLNDVGIIFLHGDMQWSGVKKCAARIDICSMVKQPHTNSIVASLYTLV